MISACVIALAACGGDDGEGAAGSAGTASGGTGGGDSGSGGTGGGDSGSGGTGGGDSGAGGTGGTGGMAPPVMCGGMTCPTPASASLRACCVDDGDVCGEEIRGGFIGDCAVPAVPDDECEGVMLMTFQVTGCCDEGRCGIGAGIIFGDPCTSIEELQELAQGDGGPDGMSGMFGNLTPKACTP